MSDLSSLTSEAIVKRIAVFNPYLQGGHTKTAEMESTARFIACAQKRGIEVKMFDNSHDIISFKPDFVFSITYQTGKLTSFPTYMNVNIPVTMIRDVNRFVRNILSCDGFVTVSGSVKEWLKSICKQFNKDYLCCAGYFSVERNVFQPSNYRNATCAYMGTNWDGTRHSKLFNLLSGGEYLKCYGPSESWKLYPKTLFGGEVPFDGISTLRMYNKSGAGLCIGHPEFDLEGIANNRMYEIVASGAMPIASMNPLTKEFYGNSILYFDHLDEPEKVASSIVSSIEWVRANSKTAEEMVRAAHDIFNKNLSIEYYLDQMINMHQQYLSKHKIKNLDLLKVKANQKLLYVIVNPIIDVGVMNTISSIFSQESVNPSILLLSKNEPIDLIDILKNNYPSSNIEWIRYYGEKSNHELFNILNKLSPKFISLLCQGDVIFKNFSLVLSDAISKGTVNESESGSLVACSLSHSLVDDSLEYCEDEHAINYHDFFKIKSFISSDRFSLSSVIFSVQLFQAYIAEKNIYDLSDVSRQALSVLGIDPVVIPEIVSSAFLDAHHANENLHYVSLVKSLENDIASRDRAINQIINSRSWRYLCRVRGVIGKLKAVCR